MSHINDLFAKAGETGQQANEAFDTQLDYRIGAGEQQPEGGTRGLIGSFALLITSEEKAGAWQSKFDSWRQRRKQARAERRAGRGDRRRAKYGDLDSLSFENGTLLSSADVPQAVGTVYENARLVGEEPEPDPHAAPRKVAGAPGVYRSNFSENQPADELPLSNAEYDEIMAGAVVRARAALGEIPVAQVHQPTEDELLIQRLERAYGQPAQEPDRSGHVGQHRAPEPDRDDQLTSTNA